jgi:hypothetical protein
MPRGSKLKNWGKEQKDECTRQFNLFTTTNGADGWNPAETADSYIRPKAKDNDILRPYLSAFIGGHSSCKDSSKVLRGYRRAGSEYIVYLAKNGIRRST